MSNVTFAIIARDEASATFRKVGVETQTLGSKLKTLVAGAGLATLGYEAVRFGKDSVKAFADTQTAQAKLADAFQRFPALADVTIGSLRDLNMALEAKTGADHNALASGEAVLAGFKLTGAQIRQIIPLVGDYAAKTGQDIPTAATGVGRALLGNTRALKSIGIEFKATGNTAADFATITGLLQAKLGGFATREGKTAAGQLKILQAEFRDVEEQIGAALLPALLDLGHFLLHDVIPPVRDTAHFLEDNKNVIEPLAKSVLLAAAAWKTYTLAVKAAQAVSAFRGTAAAGRLAEGVGSGAAGAGLGVFSVARPLPVYVVNNVDPGAPFPAPGPAAESEASRASKFFNSPAAKALIVPAVGYAVFKAMSSNLARGGIGIPGVFQIGGEKKIDPEGNLAPAFRKQVDALGGIDKALAYYQKLNLAASWSDKTLTSAVQNSTASLKEQAKALADTQSKALDLSSGQDSLRQAIHNMAVTASGQSSRALKGNSDAALANRDALRGAVSQAETYLQILKQHGASAGTVAQTELNLAKAIKRNADQTYGNRDAVKALLKELGFLPAEIANVISSINQLPAAWNSALGSTRRGLSDFGAPNKKAHDAGGALGKSLTSGYSAVVTPGIAKATSAAFDTAKSKMQADLSSIKQYFASQKATFLSAFGTISTTPGTDSLGGSFGAAASIKAQLKQDATQMHIFAKDWRRLADMGLDPRLLAQFVGPEYIPAMQELLRGGRKEIRQVDRLERRISRDAAGIARQATSDKFTPLIHDDLVHLPPKLVKPFEQALRNAGFGKHVDPDKRQGHRVSGML